MKMSLNLASIEAPATWEALLPATPSEVAGLLVSIRACGALLLYGLYFSLRITSVKQSSRSSTFSVLPLPRREL